MLEARSTPARWRRYGKMAVRDDVDPDLLRRVYLELLRLEKAARQST